MKYNKRELTMLKDFEQALKAVPWKAILKYAGKILLLVLAILLYILFDDISYISKNK